MYKILLNNEIEKLKAQNIAFKIEPGKFDLADMQEISSNKPYIDLAGAVLIVKKVTFYGIFNTDLFTSNTEFIKLISAYNYIDLSNDLTIKQTNKFVEISSEFASVHEVKFLMQYDLTKFIEPDPAQIFHASLEYFKIHKLNK